VRGTSRAIVNADHFNVRPSILIRFIPLVLGCIALTACEAYDDETAGVIDICPIHHVRMARGKVAGEIAPPPDPRSPIPTGFETYEKLKETTFPFDGSYRPAGDVLPTRPALIYVCPECVRAAKEYWKAVGSNQSTDPTLSSGTPAAGQLARHP
jgi:hypothetical protein